MTKREFHDPLDGLNRSNKSNGSHGLPKPDPTVYGHRVHRQEGKVSRIDMLTHDTCEFVVQCDPKSDVLRPDAGQYAVIDVGALDRPRSFSFARAHDKEQPGEHTFFIRNVPGGKFSEWLFGDKDRVGETLTIGGPMGTFRLDESERPMLCIAGGSGMSAIFALLEHAQLSGAKRDALFLYGARTQADLYMLDEIAAIGKAWHKDAKFEFVPVLSEEPEDSDWKGERGFVTNYMEGRIGRTGEQGGMQAADLIAYFCGPPPMIDAGISVLQGMGVPEECIRHDKFEDARSPAPVIDNTKCVLCDECLLVKPQADCIVELASLGGKDDYRRIMPSETSGLYYNSLYINESECIRCYACVDACPADAIDPGNEAKPKALRKLS